MASFSPTTDIQKCIDECLKCYKVCLQTAMNHCLEAGGSQLEAQRFRLIMDTAEICRTAADMMLGNSSVYAYVCAACAHVCDACAASCEQVGDMDECVAACLTCGQSCHEMTGSTLHMPDLLRPGSPDMSANH